MAGDEHLKKTVKDFIDRVATTPPIGKIRLQSQDGIWEDVGEVTDIEMKDTTPKPESLDSGDVHRSLNQQITTTVQMSGRSIGRMMQMLEEIYGGPVSPWQAETLRQVLIVGVGATWHQHPGPLCPCGGHRAEHARARRLYSERLRRDRRRIRKGRKPILKTIGLRTYFPNAMVRPRREGSSDMAGMEIIASSVANPGTAYVVSREALNATLRETAEHFRFFGESVAQAAEGTIRASEAYLQSLRRSPFPASFINLETS